MFEDVQNGKRQYSMQVPTGFRLDDLMTRWCTVLWYQYKLTKPPVSEGFADLTLIAPHLSEGGGLIQLPPGKCSINGPNERFHDQKGTILCQAPG